MSDAHLNRSRVGSWRGLQCRGGLASALAPALVFGALVTARPARGAERAPTAVPTPAVEAPSRPLSLDLNHLLDQRGGGHAEFNLAARRAVWDHPMARLGFSLAREESAARRGGAVGQPVPFTAGSLLLRLPGPDARLVLAGPFAEDWPDLSTGERVGRIVETAVTYGVIFEILRGLGRPPRR